MNGADNNVNEETTNNDDDNVNDDVNDDVNDNDVCPGADLHLSRSQHSMKVSQKVETPVRLCAEPCLSCPRINLKKLNGVVCGATSVA